MKKMTNRHTSYDLKQMQSLPLEAKIIMTKRRISAWYESWKRYEIFNKKTEKTRFVTATEEPLLKENEYIETATMGWVYVSFSGGKDSTVLKHIIDSMYSDVPTVFVNTGLEYPEIQTFVREIKSGKYDCFNPNVEMVRPEMRFDDVLKKYGYPVISKDISKRVKDGRAAIKNGNDNSYALIQMRGEYLSPDGKKSPYNCEKWAFLLDSPFKISSQCCDVMKKRPIHKFEKETGRIPFIGTMADESRQRTATWLKNGCNAFDKRKPSSQPLSFWTEQDILQYIQKFNVPYCPVYGDIISDNDQLKTSGCSRTGCMFCMFGCHLDKGQNRFQRLKETHPRQYEYCIGGGEMVDGKWQPSKEGLGLGKVLDFINVDYE